MPTTLARVVPSCDVATARALRALALAVRHHAVRQYAGLIEVDVRTLKRSIARDIIARLKAAMPDARTDSFVGQLTQGSYVSIVGHLLSMRIEIVTTPDVEPASATGGTR